MKAKMTIGGWGRGTVAAALVFLGAGAWAMEEGADSESPLLPLTPVVDSTGTADPVYFYRADRARDPFVPLVGAGGKGFDVGPAAGPVGPFNPVGAELKGILKTSTGRWAVLRTAEGGAYMVQNGKIYDPKRKVVEGYQGIVKEKTLVILGPKNQEVEIRLKKDEDAANAAAPR